MIRRRLLWAVLACAVTLPLAMSGCATVESVKSEIPRQPPGINLSGVWESTDWELARLRQNDSEVSGWIGDFWVRGVVTGKEAFLFLMSRGQAQYTMRLAQTDSGTLEGDYFNKLATYRDMSSDDAYRRPVFWQKAKDAPLIPPPASSPDDTAPDKNAAPQ
jgi:hypothetical protein